MTSDQDDATKSGMQKHELTLKQFSIVHLSDLHFGIFLAEDQKLAIKNAIRNLPDKPSLILVSGDFTNSPSEGWAMAARAFLDDLQVLTGANLVVCPGNHDVKFFGMVGRTFRDFKNAFGDIAERRFFPDIGVSVYPLVTVTKGFLAKGKMPRMDLAQLDADFINESSSYAACPIRIALGHHHLLPVALAELDLLAPAKEPGLSMENAGQTLQALMRQGFVLALHGHHHVPGNWTLFSRSEEDVKHLSVICSGSATKGCFFSVIKFGSIGEATLQRYAKHPRQSSFVADGLPVELFPRDYVPQLFADCSEGRLKCGRVVRSLACDRFGDFRSETTYVGLRTAVPTAVDTIPFETACDIGILGSPHVAGGRFSYRDIDAKDPTKIVDNYRVRCGELVGNPPIAPDALEHLSVTTYVSNAFCLSVEEDIVTSRFMSKPVSAFENVFWRPLFRTDELTLILDLPSTSYIANIYAEVLDCNGVIRHDIGNQLTECIVVAPLRSRAMLRVPFPSTGYTYLLRWRLPAMESLGMPSDDRPTQYMRQFLLTNSAAAEALVSSLATAVAKLLGDKLTVGLMVLDEKLGALRQVAGEDTYNEFALAIGEGVAGRSFKLRNTVMWTSEARETERKNWYKKSGNREHQALIAFPISRSGKDFDPPIGIVTIGSYRPDSAISKLPTEAQWLSLKSLMDSLTVTLVSLTSATVHA